VKDVRPSGASCSSALFNLQGANRSLAVLRKFSTFSSLCQALFSKSFSGFRSPLDAELLNCTILISACQDLFSKFFELRSSHPDHELFKCTTLSFVCQALFQNFFGSFALNRSRLFAELCYITTASSACQELFSRTFGLFVRRFVSHLRGTLESYHVQLPVSSTFLNFFRPALNSGPLSRALA